ncbi:uncharacterized protein [Cicer arietinum]|uniref:Uncharacterized protein LOC101513838 n=1 Tax=Cicer arietinum TaxID=3827 RepID=A0A1S2YNV0_CICAR|nr:uncharacterized protein LOC101513838 [Cicer arietinum]
MLEIGRIPVRFDRVLAAAFESDEVARVRLCESSGSEHSAESSTDLSDLVKSFMEREEDDAVVVVHDDNDNDDREFDYSEKREILEEIFANNYSLDDAKENIRREVQLAFGVVAGDKSEPGFKRLFVSRLRERGFDAGLCKSRWEKNKRIPGGDYEYIDVNYGGNRYIVGTSLMSEFEIARPTNQYTSLLDVFPLVFVGKVEELKRVVRLMCSAIKDSMKTMDLHVPPWRRNSYMQAKWFSHYRRTTNEVAIRKSNIGFDARLPLKSYSCRDDYGSKIAFKVGHLTTAFNADGFGM